MELKSVWFTQAAILLELILRVSQGTYKEGLAALGYVLFFALSVIIAGLFQFEKTKKIGTSACIVWGLLILFVFGSGSLQQAMSTHRPPYDDIVMKMSVIPGEVLPAGIFLILAGILQLVANINGWYVALIGILLQVISGNALTALIGIVPVTLLYFERTKKIGAITSILMGIAAFVMIANFLGILSTAHTTGEYMAIASVQADDMRYVHGVINMMLYMSIGTFFMLAGILHFKEKI